MARSPGPAPQVAINAAVGLGKTSAARRQLIDLRRTLAGAEGRPSRILILTPSLALADETAEAWRDAGERVAVMRGYQRKHPTLRRPICADLPVVNAAIESGEDVQTTACHSSSGRRCTHFESCPKQANRAEVAEADVVIAAYDALFTGTTMPPESIGLILIDEGFWQRASDTLDGLSVESFAHERYGARKLLGTQGGADTEAELQALWTSAVEAFDAGGEGRFRGGICLRPV